MLEARICLESGEAALGSRKSIHSVTMIGLINTDFPEAVTMPVEHICIDLSMILPSHKGNQNSTAVYTLHIINETHKYI